MEGFLQAASINSCAIVVSPDDNVAVVKRPIEAATLVELESGRIVRVTGNVGVGNRFATTPIPAGHFVLQYGQPIGTSLGIGEGDPVSHANMSDDVPVRRDLPDDLCNLEPARIPPGEVASFMGFRRPDGRVGTR